MRTRRTRRAYPAYKFWFSGAAAAAITCRLLKHAQPEQQPEETEECGDHLVTFVVCKVPFIVY